MLTGHNLKNVIKYFTEDAQVRQWKQGIESITVLAKLGPDLKIVHELNKKQIPMDQRDFVVAEYMQQNQTSFIITSFSVQYPGYETADKGRERGEVFFRQAILNQKQEGVQLMLLGSQHPKGNISGTGQAEKIIGKVVKTVEELRKCLGLK